MVEEEQAHRIGYEKTQLSALVSDTKRGHYIALLICLAAIVGAVTTAVIGAPWEIGVALVGVPILGIIQAIVGSKAK